MRSMIILSVFAVVSCSASPPTRFFALDPVGADLQRPTRIDTPIKVDAVHIPSTLDRQEMVRGESDHEQQISSQDRWSADFGEMIRRVLTQDLQHRLPHDMVIPPRLPAPANASGVVVNILSFEPTTSGTVLLDADWTLVAGSPPQPAFLRTVHLSEPVGNTPASQAASMSDLLGQLADEIVKGVAQEERAMGRAVGTIKR